MDRKIVSLRPAWAIYQDPVTKKRNKMKRKEKRREEKEGEKEAGDVPQYSPGSILRTEKPNKKYLIKLTSVQ